MKKLLDLTDEKRMEWLINTVDGKPSGGTDGAIIKGKLLIELAELMQGKKPAKRKTTK